MRKKEREEGRERGEQRIGDEREVVRRYVAEDSQR